MKKKHLLTAIPTSPRHRLPRGLTLLELLITVAITSILITAVGPNIQSLLVSNKVAASINDLSGLMRFARHTAINEQVTAKVCPTADFSNCSTDWSGAKMVFVDTDGSGGINGNEKVIASTEQLTSALSIKGLTGDFSFAPDGSASSSASVVICPTSKDAKLAKALIITTYGKISVSNDSNGNGVDEDGDGKQLSC